MNLENSSNETSSICCAVSRDTPQPTTIGANLQKPVDGNHTSDSDMSLIPGGVFSMGTDYEGAFSSDGEGPVRKVRVDPFYIDKIAVTNTKFARFTRETGYRTEAEKFGWSFVFTFLLLNRRLHHHYNLPRAHLGGSVSTVLLGDILKALPQTSRDG